MVMRQRLKLDNKGLTLIELMIGLALTGVVMAAVAVFLIGNINFSNTAQDEIYVQEQVRKAMKSFTNLVMDKEEMLSSTEITLENGDSYTESATFTRKDEAGEDEQLKIEYDSSLKELKYTLGKDLDGSPIITNSGKLAENIVLFKIEKDENNSKLLEVTIKGIKNEGKKDESNFELTNKVLLRNYKEPEVPSG